LRFRLIGAKVLSVFPKRNDRQGMETLGVFGETVSVFEGRMGRFSKGLEEGWLGLSDLGKPCL
jgi:hypothetical protein